MDIGDHCTVCHRCVKPCPVNIDFGDVTVAVRNYLADSGHKRFAPAASMGMAFLNATGPKTIKALRAAMIQTGFPAQNFAYKIGKLLPIGTKKQKAEPKATVGTASIKEQVIHFINRPLPKSVPAKTPRSMLGIEDDKSIPIIATRLRRKMPRPCSTSQVAALSACSAKSDLPFKPCFGMSVYKPSCRRAICVAAIRKTLAAIRLKPKK